LFAALASIAASCRESDPGVAHARLSEYGLFIGDPSAQLPATGVVAYAVNTPLFSDYAEKLRFVRLPEGRSAVYRGEGVFDFPVGTTIVKTFYYPKDFRMKNGPRRLIETRLLIHDPDGWVGLPYVWNDAQTEAELRITGARVPVEWIDPSGMKQSVEYRVPSASDCGICHRSGAQALAPLATKPAQLNRVDGGRRFENQLARWEQEGLLVGLPAVERVPRYPDWGDEASGTLENRARAYLDANCAHCHNPMGYASGAQLDLRYEQREPRHIGVFKRPVAAGRGSGDLFYDISPGQPDDSILLYRMESMEPGVMMPELGRTTTHWAGVRLVREWIASLR